MGDEDRKDASTTIASEALKVLPEPDKQMAGRSLGGALTNLGAALEDVTLWIRLVASVPRGATTFVAKVIDRWRGTPSGRRALPSPKLLLEAAAGYGAADEDDLKIRYERLLFSAIDSNTSARVHPAFVMILGEMTGTEARLLDYFPVGGYFDSYEALISALGFPLDRHQFAVATRNLVRLGLVDAVYPALVEPLSANTPALKQSLAKASGGIHVEDESRVMLVDDDATSTALVKQTAHYRLTAIGQDFLAVVGKRASTDDDR